MKSIAHKLMVLISLLIITILCLLITMNLFFMDDYYIFKTRSFLNDEIEIVKTEVLAGERELNRILEERSQETGYKYTITDKSFTVKFSSQQLPKRGTPNRLQRYLINAIKSIGDEAFYGKVLRENGDKSDVTIAKLINGTYYVIITKPLDQLKESAAIANSLVIITGLILLVIGLILSYLLSRSVVKPILEITEISKDIAQLNFNNSFSSKSQDEIAVLGNSINHISDKLGSTIEQLKNEMVLQKRFLASISHELKTPISLIRGYTESLSMDIDKREREEFSSIIIEESDRLNLLMNDLMLLLKIGSTAFTLNKSHFDISETIERVLDRLDNSNIEITKPAKLEIYADEKRIIQVITNIVTNANKYCLQDGVIRLKLYTSDYSTVLDLYNSCEPIPEEQLEHLFDPFYSLEDSRNRSQSGTGLGLSIVQSIMEKHGGSCSASYSDGGITISLQIPSQNHHK